jgi:hypothetical protein
MNNEDHEIEMRAVLTDEQYSYLKTELPKIMHLLKHDNFTTYKFVSENTTIMIRYADTYAEMVMKDGIVTKVTRKESTIKLASKEDALRMVELLRQLAVHEDPHWFTDKAEFSYEYDGYEYTASLQDIERFAKILEVEYLGNRDEEQLHVNNIKKIFSKFDIVPVPAKEFKEMIKRYIAENDKK